MAAEAANLIKCGICMERFNQDDHKPKFLQCYHTFCSHCLTKIQEKRSSSNGGGIEFPCPTCRKPTRVGKKGVAALQDNFYLFPLSAKAQEDEVYVSDDGEDSCRSTPPPDEANNSAVKVWCNKCLKVAGPECSLHDICNLELGRKRLYTRLQTAVEQLTHELDMEVLNREPQLTHLRGAHEAWMSEVFEYLKDQINEQSMALTVARSELESVPSLSKLKDEPDPNIIAAALKKAESQLARSENHNKAASKQAALWSALQKCQINIHSTELPELTIDVTGGDSNQEKLLMYLLYYMLENSSPGGGNHSWQVIKAKGKEQIKTQTFKPRMGSSLASTPAVSTESLSSLQKIKTTLNKGPGTLNKGLYCFFDISVDGKPHGRVVIHLRTDLAPKMCANFIALCTGEVGYGYQGSKIFKTTNDHIVGGDFERNDGTGGHSIYNNKGLFVADNCSLMDEKGAVRMRGMGTDSVGGGGMVGSQFHIWVGDRDFRPYRRTLVIGHVVEGLDLCKAISTLRTYKNAHGTYIIAKSVVIQNCGKL